MSRHHLQRAVIVAGLLLTGISLNGCGDVNNSSDVTDPPPAPTSAIATDDPESQYLGYYEGIPEDTSGPRTPTAEQQQDAMERATTALEAYYATDKAADEWFEDLRPLLSRQAQTAYETVDPARIPDVEITGEPSVVRHEGGGAITIAVPTTAGDTQVELIVEEAGHDWSVDRFRFPSDGG